MQGTVMPLDNRLGIVSFITRGGAAVFVSDLLKNRLVAKLPSLVQCIEHVSEDISVTSALPGYEHNAKKVDDARKAMDDFVFQKVKNLNSATEKILLKLFSTAIQSQKSGNCYEYAFLAKNILNKMDISSEIFRVKGNKENDNHIFLVIDRDLSTDPKDFSTWNENCVVVDPYMQKIYEPKEIPSYLESCVYDEGADLVRYVRFDPKEHQLDCEVINEFLEDWKKVINATKQDSSRNMGL